MAMGPESYFADALDSATSKLRTIEMKGRVAQAVGTLIKAAGVSARIGDVCELSNPGDDWKLSAEVVGVTRDGVLLMPYGELTGISLQTHVTNLGCAPHVEVGAFLLGKMVDGFGNLLHGDISDEEHGQLTQYPIQAAAPDPLRRIPVTQVFQTGVKSIDALLTCGRGQRIGIFAPAGAGKSTLLSMIAQGTDSDVNVVALIGERGREVGDFLQHLAATGKMDRTICVIATSDRSAAERAKAPCVAMAIAEYFRDHGKSVLLMMDSVTRYARALREIGLAAGEPPTRRGYPPSVLTALPKLFERAGQNDKGAITSFFTVLVEDDATGDPIGEEVRATLDGHIVLSPKLADENFYPAIDVLLSRSRVMRQVVPDHQFDNAGKLRELMHKHQSIEMLVQMGEYEQGSDALADQAISAHDAIRDFLRQRAEESVAYEDAIQQLDRIVRG